MRGPVVCSETPLSLLDGGYGPLLNTLLEAGVAVSFYLDLLEDYT